MEVLVVVQEPADYRTAIDAWRRMGTVLQELPPRLALALPRGEVTEVPGSKWYSGAVPQDVLLSLEPPARIFIAGWLDRQRPAGPPGDHPSGDARGYLKP
jgi:hypothetical protein